jgi:hypothetical protein
MHSADPVVRRDGWWLVLVFGVATLVMAVYGVVTPEHRFFSLAFFFLGLVGTWRHYRNWRRTR